jgi:hypothetical protein
LITSEIDVLALRTAQYKRVLWAISAR